MADQFPKSRGAGDAPPFPDRRVSQASPGFSEAALRGLSDLDARLPPPDAVTEPAHGASFRMTDRLRPDAAAGGGLLRDATGAARPHYWGHRERLRTRFLEGGHAPMPEYELLELLLFNAIARIDVKPLAKRLLAEFGDLNGVIAAPSTASSRWRARTAGSGCNCGWSMPLRSGWRRARCFSARSSPPGMR